MDNCTSLIISISQLSDNGVISLDSTFKGGTLDSYTYDNPWLAPYGADVGKLKWLTNWNN